MTFIKHLSVWVLLAISTSPFANGCCGNMGGILYCDSSASRFVCRNGYFSACYCTRHAVMDLQKIEGCCLWRGGVMPGTDASGLVVCRDGSQSELCSLQNMTKPASSW